MPGKDPQSNRPIPAQSTDSLNTANQSRVVLKEIERLTKELIEDTKAALGSKIDLVSINLVDGETETDFFPDLARDAFNEYVSDLQEILDLGDNQNTYLRYLDLFSVRYNDTGEAIISLNINLENYNSEYIELVDVVKEGKI
jgi:hypothetical protein